MRVEQRAWSPVLGEEIAYRVHAVGPGPRHSAYLLHGRGGTASDWDRVVPRVEVLVAQGVLPPLLLVAVDAPWSGRAGWYVDSAFTGEPPGRPVAAGLLRDLVPLVEAEHGVLVDRSHRMVAGVSMGAAGAVRLLLAHPDVFGSGIALAVPAWHPQPPRDSSARRSGAFGVGAERFVGSRWTVLHGAGGGVVPARIALAVGSDDPLQDVTVALARRLGVAAPAVWPGGHDWDVWEPAFVSALRSLVGHRSQGAGT